MPNSSRRSHKTIKLSNIQFQFSLAWPTTLITNQKSAMQNRGFLFFSAIICLLRSVTGLLLNAPVGLSILLRYIVYMEAIPHECRNIAPAGVNLHAVRVTDVLAEQSHIQIQPEWPGDHRPPLELISAVEVLAAAESEHMDGVSKVSDSNGAGLSAEQVKGLTPAALKYYRAKTVAQAVGRAINWGDLAGGYSVMPDSQLRKTVRAVVRAWERYPEGPAQGYSRYRSEAGSVYDVLGTDFPPAVVRRGYELGYCRPDEKSVYGWHNRWVFTPLIDKPEYELEASELQALRYASNGMSGPETPAGRRDYARQMRSIDSKFGLEESTVALRVTLAVAMHEVDPPIFDERKIRLYTTEGLEVLSRLACGHRVRDAAGAIGCTERQARTAVRLTRERLRTRLAPAAIARLFTVNAFLVGRVTEELPVEQG